MAKNYTINSTEVGLTGSVYTAPDVASVPDEISTAVSDTAVYVPAAEWRPNVSFGIKDSFVSELTVTAVMPLSFIPLDERSSFTTDSTGDVTTYRTFTRVAGPKLSVTATHTVSDKLGLQFETGAGFNSYMDIIETSTANDGAASRDFSSEAKANSAEVFAGFGMRLPTASVNLGATYDSVLGFAPTVSLHFYEYKLNKKAAQN